MTSMLIEVHASRSTNLTMDVPQASHAKMTPSYLSCARQDKDLSCCDWRKKPDSCTANRPRRFFYQARGTSSRFSKPLKQSPASPCRTPLACAGFSGPIVRHCRQDIALYQGGWKGTGVQYEVCCFCHLVLSIKESPHHLQTPGWWRKKSGDRPGHVLPFADRRAIDRSLESSAVFRAVHNARMTIARQVAPPTETSPHHLTLSVDCGSGDT
jgi:hypothetical protein